MAPAISKFDMENGRKKRDMYAVKPAIPLERPKRAKYDPSELVKFELYRNPEDTSSAKYTISIPKFSGGTPEEILNFFDQVQEVMTGQSITEGPMRYKVLQSLLEGDPLAKFNNSAEENGAKTVVNYQKCKCALIKHLFPHRALQYQKRYMRNKFQKPSGWTIRRFIARVQEINNKLDKFPPFEGDQKLAEAELIEIAKYGAPLNWQNELSRQNFEASEHTLQDVIEFFERLAVAKGREVTHDAECLRRVDEKIPKKRSPSGSQDYDPYSSETFCDFCGKKGHSLKECRNYKRAKLNYNSMSVYNKQGKYPNKTNTYKTPSHKKEYDKEYKKRNYKENNKKNYVSREEVKVMLERNTRKLQESMRTNAPRKRPEVHNLDDSDTDMRSVKRKITYSSSDDSEQEKSATLKYDSESDKSSDDNSEVSHYGFEDRDDELFSYNKK